MRVWLLQRNEPTPHDSSGVQRIFRTGIMARMLAEAGHKVVWWTSDYDHYNRVHRYGKHHRESVIEGYNIQYIHSRGYKKNISLDRIKANQEVASSFAAMAAKEFRKPEIIIASIPTAELALEGLYYAQKHSIALILDIRDLWPDHIISLAPTIAKPMVRLLLRPMIKATQHVFSQATGIFGLTEPFLNWGLSYAGRARNQYDRVVPMGYVRTGTMSDDQLAKAKTYWDELGVSQDSDELIVAFVGTIGLSSDLNTVFEAAKRLQSDNKRVKFVICGDGEAAGALREKAKHLDNWLNPGWINNAQIKALLMRSDIGLLPYINSDNYTKNLPNKPAEYLSEQLLLASGLSFGPLNALIDEFDCGFSYSGSVEYLAENLSFYSENPEQLTLQKANAHEAFVKRLNGEVVYRQMIEFLEQLVAENVSRKELPKAVYNQ